MRTWPGLGLLLLTTLLIQVSLAEDLYWEGEDNASNEFLEVKDDSSLPGHLMRFKRQWWNFFDTSSTTAAPATEPAPENEVVTDDPDDGGFDTKDDDDHIEGSGAGPETNRVDAEVVPEKTLRVTFVVVQPYQVEYSNRDSVEFQQFSKTLAQAVDDLFVKLPGTQKASLIRIQSRLADNFSCKVTLDIVTTGYDNTDRITATLRDHIRDYRYLGDVSVKDDDFSANAVNPGSSFVTCNTNEIQCDDGSYCISLAARCNGNTDCTDGSDERGCPIDADKFVVEQQSTGVDSNPPIKPVCANPIPCSSSSVTICPEQRCNGIPECPLEDDESPELCNTKPGPERGDQSLYVTTPETADLPETTPYPKSETQTVREPAVPSQPDTTPYYKSEDSCYPGEFRCDETRCISKSSVCNNYNDCSDGTDELNCPETCGLGDYQCDRSNRCIEASRRCDGVADCPDADDEQGCACDPNDFRCTEDGACIESRKRCDGVSNCRDGSDELDCACGTDQWQCDQGSCIQRSQRCDGRVDCPSDRSDERNCVAKGHFKCRSGKLIPEHKRCDRHYDCPSGDYSDEHNCPCGVDDFKCKNGHCIPKNKHCDRTNDCQDGSDELRCNYGKQCMAYQFNCESGQCVHAESYCNGTVECLDGSDEIRCPCKRGQFRCSDGVCINIALICNGHSDCEKGEDEASCDAVQCPEGTIKCESGAVKCGTRCNQIAECENSEDEDDCAGECPRECDGRCLNENQICDGNMDCTDQSDEIGCEYCNGYDDFRCLDDSDCLKASLRCNNIAECSDGSDEKGCNDTMIPNHEGCSDSEFKCSDGICINKQFYCDGNIDCYDQSDEINCSWFMTRSSRSPSLAPCHDAEFTCYDGRCIPSERRCDNFYDCSDFSDEQNCHDACREDQFQCLSRECIPYFNKCDGHADCRDQSDELECPGNDVSRFTTEYPYRTTTSRRFPDFTTTARWNDQYRPNAPNGARPDNRLPTYGTPERRPNYDVLTTEREREPSPTTDRYEAGYPSNNGDDNNLPPGTTEMFVEENSDVNFEPTPSYTDRYDPYGQGASRPGPNPSDNGNQPDRFGGSTTPGGGYGQEGQSGYPGSNGDPYNGGRYPNVPRGGSGQEGQYGYPGSNGEPYNGGSYPNAPSGGTGQEGQSGYPGSNGEPYNGGSYPNAPSGGTGQEGQSGYPGSNGEPYNGGSYPNAPSGGTGQEGQSGYPGSNGEPYNGGSYPNAPSGGTGQEGQSGYPGSNGEPYNGGRYPNAPSGGSGQEGQSGYPGSNGDPYNNGVGYTTTAPGGSYGQEGQYGYPGSSGGSYDGGRYPNGPSGGYGQEGQFGYPDSNGGGRPQSGSQSGGSAGGGAVPCQRHEWRCENGPCIDARRRCDGHIDCPFDFSDEFDCPPGSPITLDIQTHPDEQSVRFGGDVVFQCRDKGPLRASVRWVREGGRSMKPGFSDKNGRLELYQVTSADSGVYICQAPRYLGHPKSEARVTLTVEPDNSPPARPVFTPCKPYEASCSDGGCIPKEAVCNGKVDCADRSDEDRCPINGSCEPNQFQCDNRKCVLKTWRCDSEDDCEDGSDEICEALPGQACRPTEFSCHSLGQCVPRSFHCDRHKDCLDNSDEIGCADAYVVQPPTPANVHLKAGETLVLRAEARGVPTPFISWRLNWGHVPVQCTSTSENGTGILTCPNMQPEHNGAYSAEALNHRVTVFAVPDAIVMVTKTSPCPPATFNIDARSERECISCFCFGKTTQCHSAELFTYNMATPLGEGGSRMVGVTITPYGEVRTGGSIANHYYYQPMQNAFAVTKLASYEDTSLGRFHPYVTLPELYQGQQLTSYGGHIKFTLIPHSRAYEYDDSAPTIIVKGKYETLFYFHRDRVISNETLIDVRLTPENWVKPRPNGLEPAARQDLMMALDDITAIYLRADLNNAGVNISNFVMESAQHIDVGLGAANLVEDCKCPPGYEGLSCQKCAAGYTRKENSDPWSTDCVRESCPPGTYGDPAIGLACKPCPCPLTNRENQFARTCSLGRDGRVNCDCFPNYEGQNCESCAPGYEGNPLMQGDTCRIKTTERCNSIGTETARHLDECVCKENVQGRYCDHCKANSYYLSNDFRGGCALCFCTGIPTNCTSGNLRRKTTFLNFNVPNIVNQVRVYNSSVPIATGAFSFGAPIETDLKPVLGTSGLTIRGLDNRRQTVYYWSLPSNFAGDKVTSYGGFLRYTLENVPSFLNVRSRSLTAADVQLISDNHITIQYSEAFKPTPEGVLNATVQFLESKWHNSDGSEVSRAIFMLALADVKAILIKATYGDSIATPLFASIDTAESDGTGPVALHVEECNCPVGHKGYSCEDCAPGYTRGADGIYLEVCVPCNCNKHSTECHPETGVCYGCMDNTDGPQCELCKEGYKRDEYNNCVEIEITPCRCDPRGTEGPCDASGRCYCKMNVEGQYCDRCRAGTFGLEARNPAGCIECFCSDATQQCQEAHHYTRIAMAALIFGDDYGGYALTDLNAETVISDQFVPVPDKSELVYVFPYPPSEELYWSLPVFPGNRVLSYGGSLSLRQEFKSNTYEVSEPGTDVVLIGDSISIYWTNPHKLRSQQSMSYQVPLMEHGWYRLGTAVPVSRRDFMRVLKSLRRVLVRATIAPDLVSTTIADVSMDTATQSTQTDAQAALGVELCLCPPGYLGTSCESCAAGYYKDAQNNCTQCPCNGHECQLHANGEVTCNCRPPYTGYDCSTIVGESQGTTHRPVSPESTVTVRISGDKRIIIQEVGTSVNFTCQAMSRINSNRLRVSWSKKDGYLPRNRAFVDENSGVLKIVNVQITDSGIYVCQAYDGVGSNQAAITLRVPANVMTIPTVTIEPAVEEYYEGDRVELVCKTQGTPMPTISWQRASRKPLPYTSQQIDDLFIIENVRQEDSGEYSCTASNSAGSGSNIAVVNVRPRPSSPQRDQLKVSPQAPIVDEGQSTRVVCTGSTNVPAGTIDWVRQDNTRFQGNVHSDNGVLFIDVATLENAGVYLCQTHGADVAPATVLVTVTPLTTPSPSETSKITVSVKHIKIPEGESGYVDCTPSGVELPQIKWSRYQGEFGPGTSQRGDTLIINNAHESDKGYYICEGRVRGALIETSYVFVDIDKREAPRVEIYPAGVQPVALGSTFEFHCRVLGGIPEPVITWSRSGGRALSSTTGIKPKNILRFEQVDVNDDGEYICTASNIVTSVSDTAVIRVRASPTIQITPSNYIQVSQGEPITVDCRADGRPDPMVSIRGPNLREAVSPSLRIASLRITAARDSDDGNYACIATSEAGSTESPFVIVVDRGDGGYDGGGSGENNIEPGYDSINPNPVNPDYNQFPEERPHDLVVNDGSSQAVAECNVTPEEYGPRWERSDRKPLQKNAMQEGNKLIISDVSSRDSGEYICSVYSYETGDVRVAQYIRLLVVRAPVITLVPLTQTVRPGDSPTVECQVDGDDIIDTHWSIDNASGRVEVRGTTLIFNNIQVEDAGQYECFARNRYVNASNKASVFVAAPTEQVQLVRIEQSLQRYNIGDNVQVNCRALSPDVNVNWEKFGTRQYVEIRRYGGGAVLIVPKVTIGDAGVYRCTAVDPRGRTSYEDFNLEVEPGSLNTVYPREKDVLVSKHTARLHDTVVMPCSYNLEEPININWKRLYSQLPADVRTDQPQLVLTNVNEGDAGTYVCRVSNNRVVVETRAVLRVTGVVPSFNGDSWIALMPIKDAYRQFEIEVSFKPADSNGIILYNSERPDRNGKYIALHMKNGVPEFVMDTGYGPVYVQGDRPLQLQVWHTIRVNWIQSRVTMDVDNGGQSTNKTSGNYLLDLKENLYVGGVRDADSLPTPLAGSPGFIGCVGMLILGHEEKNLMIDSVDQNNVLECDTCAPNFCQNDGVCQEARNERGYRCICAKGFAGLDCDRRGEACHPELCGPGKCQDTADGYKCACPVTHTGKHCENTQSIAYPAFTGSAYIALKPPNSYRFLKMSMKIKAENPVQDGIIMYCAESSRGLGGFTSLAVRNKRLEFRYDLNEGNPVVLVSNTTLQPDDWTDVQITRAGPVVSLNINLKYNYEQRLDSANKSLELGTPMFVGGVDENIILNNNTGVTGGFNGCIKDVKTHGNSVNIVSSSIQSANVKECLPRGDIQENLLCSCSNGGTCLSDGSCECPPEYTGFYCDTRVPDRRAADPCAAQPCRNGGTCRVEYYNPMNHTCDCRLGYAGAYCQIQLHLSQNVGFNGNGYIELPASLINYESVTDPVMMALAFHTTQPGVLLFQSQISGNYRNDYSGDHNGDYIMIKVDIRGYVVVEWDKGGGVTSLTIDSPDSLVTDGELHKVVVRFLSENRVELTVDHKSVTGITNGFADIFNADTNIYIGGLPEGLYRQYDVNGLDGCIDQVEFMDMGPVNFGDTAVTGRNTQRCRDRGRNSRSIYFRMPMKKG